MGSNIAFLRDLLEMPEFVTGTHNTAALEITYSEGWNAPITVPQQLVEAVLSRFPVSYTHLTLPTNREV